ncbi:tripartite motif-containing protein 67-like [Engraulis encrasicolus]|uniref:tripartite motif-containing protein 67-like n=1 Tax=Engraulis encrasicolus TaxID=184585 RepID=UPI002FCED12B
MDKSVVMASAEAAGVSPEPACGGDVSRGSGGVPMEEEEGPTTALQKRGTGHGPQWGALESGVLGAVCELLGCPGCGRFLLRPITLPCGHCLCPACLTRLAHPRNTHTRKAHTRNLTSKGTAAPPAPTATPSDSDPSSISADAPAQADQPPAFRCPRCQAACPLLLPGEGPSLDARWSYPPSVLLSRMAQGLLDAHPELRRLARRGVSRRHGNTWALRSSLRRSSRSLGWSPGSGSADPWALPVYVEPKPAPCDLCTKQRPAARFCATCRLHFCAKCLSRQHSNPAYRAHSLVEPTLEAGREQCPAHPERSVTHSCVIGGHVRLGCHGCLVTTPTPVVAKQQQQVAPLRQARAHTQERLTQALQYASTVEQQCSARCDAMSAALCHVSGRGAELRSCVQRGFQALRSTLLDQEVSLLSRIDVLSSSTSTAAQGFLQHAAPLRASLAGLQVLGQQALLEPRDSAFLQGGEGLVHWLVSLCREATTHDPLLKSETTTHDPLLLVGSRPFDHAHLDFDALQQDLQSILDKHLRWDLSEAVAMPTAIVTGTVGEAMQEEEEEEAEEEEEKEEEKKEEELVVKTQDPEVKVAPQVEVAPGLEADTADKVPWQGAPFLGCRVEEKPLALPHVEPKQPQQTQKERDMPAGDARREVPLPRPPIIYQHKAYPNTVEVFWMVPMGDKVQYFDVHFQDANGGGVNGGGVVMGGLKGSSMCASGLRRDAEYIFRARSVNSDGHGAWGPAYRVST